MWFSAQEISVVYYKAKTFQVNFGLHARMFVIVEAFDVLL